MKTLPEFLADLVRRLKKRLGAFVDPGFLALTALSLVPLLILDRAMVLTLLQWSAFFIALAGMAIALCRVFLPQVDLSEWLDNARDSPIGAGLVALGVCVLLSSTLMAMVLWAKA